MVANVEARAGGVSLAPEEGELIRIFDEEMLVKLAGSDTGGVYAVIVGSVAPGGGPPLHAHPGNESFYVLSGEFAFTLRDDTGARSIHCGPGSMAHAPAGVPHRFENVSPTRSAMLIIGAAESVDFLRELGAAFPPGAQPDMETMLTIHEKYRIQTFHGEEGSRPEPPKDGATSERARALAWRFEQAHGRLVAAVETCPAERWSAIVQQAREAAVDEATTAERIRAIATGETYTPVTSATGQAGASTQWRMVSLLRATGELACQTYRRLAADELEYAAPFIPGAAPITVAQAIEELAIAEVERRLTGIQRAVSGS